MSASLAASTLTPGSTAPEESLTTPVTEAWAYAIDGRATRHARTNSRCFSTRIRSPQSDGFRRNLRSDTRSRTAARQAGISDIREDDVAVSSRAAKLRDRHRAMAHWLT